MEVVESWQYLNHHLIIITSSVFTNNRGNFTGPGGVMHAYGGYLLIITSCMFSNNIAMHGGVIQLDSRESDKAALCVSSSTFTKNRALRGWSYALPSIGVGTYSRLRGPET